LIEQLLVNYDWGATLVALNGVLKPVFDRLWFEQLAGIAERHEDEVLEKILISVGDDGKWHEQWFVAFSRLALESDEHNESSMARWVAELRPSVAEAAQASLHACHPLFGDEDGRAAVWRELDAGLSVHLGRAGITSEASRGAEHERSR
jgi:hypothetical protein